MKAKRQILASKISKKRSQLNEKQLTLEVSQHFKQIEVEVQKRLQEYGTSVPLLQGQVNIILSPVRESHPEYYEIIKRHVLEEFELGQQEGDRMVALNTPNVTERVINEIRRNNLFGTLRYSEDYLLQHRFEASASTLNRVDSSLNQIISDGYKSGKGINQVANDITKRFNQLESWESRRIARTEINTAHNMGTMNSYETLGVEYTQWISVDDGRTRGTNPNDTANHLILNGEIIRFGDTYSNGLQYPGDMSGPIEEWINCRCSNAPFVIPYGYVAPPFSPFHEEDLIKL